MSSYLLILDDYDCKQRRTRTIHIVEYDNKGNVTGNVEGDNVWKITIPDSIGERVFGVICLDWPDTDELNMQMAAEDFEKARQLEKKHQLDDARGWYERALKYAPENRKIIDALSRMPPKRNPPLP